MSVAATSFMSGLRCFLRRFEGGMRSCAVVYFERIGPVPLSRPVVPFSGPVLPLSLPVPGLSGPVARGRSS
ncbi:hypothetical protein D3C72_732510 [compost metagenome]